MSEKDNDSRMQVYLNETVFAGTASKDVTTNIVRRLGALTGEATARFIAIIKAAGGNN